jgi:Zn-dependent M28 family amino/carboxypeptidase
MKKTISLLLIICASLSGTLRAQSPGDLQNILNQISADSVYATVQDLQNFGSRFAASSGNGDGNRDVSEYIAHRLENYGISTEIDSFYMSGTAVYMWISEWFYNVRGVLPASNPIDDSLVIVGAHLDAIAFSEYGAFADAPGADDNASGVAVMLELARIIHANNLQFRRDIHFMAFDAEEYGLWGSYYDADKRNEAGEKIALMMNNDMVSYQPDNNWRLLLRWYDNAVDVLNRAIAICEQYTNMVPLTLPDSENVERAQRSDSYAYYEYGYRATYASEYSFSTSYHTDHDVTDSCNYPYLAEVARYNMAMLTAYADPTSGVGVENHPAVNTSTYAYPNPCGGKVFLQYQLEQDSPVSISLLDLRGCTLLHYDNGIQSAGIRHSELDLTSIPAGLYLCQIRTDKGVETLKLLRR